MVKKLFIFILCLSSFCLPSFAQGWQGIDAKNVKVETKNFDGNLGSTDNTVQKIADAVDELTVGAVTLDDTADIILDIFANDISLDTQTANTVFAGPATGDETHPTFRALVDADIPNDITITEVDGSTTNEINTITLPDANVTAGLGITFAQSGAIAITESAPDTVTFTVTEVDPTVDTSAEILAIIGNDAIKDTHIDWGSGAGQVDYSDITSGSISTPGTLGAGETTLATVIGEQGAFGVASPSATYKFHFQNNLIADFSRLVLYEALTTATSGTSSPLTFKLTSSGDMADNFGPGFLYAIQDSAGVENFIGRTACVRNGADNTGKFIVTVADAGTLREEFTIGPLGITIGAAEAGIDYKITFDGETNDGVLTWMEDEDYFYSADKWLFQDKIAFTQTDGNEYIDSLNDGYVDIGATTGIRLNSNQLTVGNTSASSSELYIKTDQLNFGSYYPEISSSLGYTVLKGGVISKDVAGVAEPAFLYFSSADETRQSYIYQGVTGAQGTNGVLHYYSNNALHDFNGSIQLPTTFSFTIGTTQWNSGDSIDGTKVANADLGDIGVSSGVWSVEDDSHNHVISNIDSFTSAALFGQINNETGSITGTPLAVFNQNPTLAGAIFTGILSDNDDMVFEIDANNDGSNKYSFTDGASGEIASLTEAGLLTVTGGLTISTTKHLLFGVVQWDNGSDKIDGEQIANDTIDDDSIDFSDVTGADLTLTDATTITASGKITANANLDVANGATSSGVLTIFEDSTDGTNYASFQVPALAGNTVYTLPPDDGDAGEQLQTNGSGVLTWEAAGGGGGSGTMTTVKEATSQVGGADIVSLDFGAGFDLTEDPDTEINITLDLTEITVDANTGDSATAFFDAGTIEHERGGLEADVSAYAGLVHITGGTTSAKIIGIAQNNIMQVSAADAANGEYAKFTATGLESKATAEVLSDIGAQATVTEGSLADSTIVSADIKNGTIVVADTAITAGRSLTWSTDDLVADAELYTDTKCIYIENPTADDDLKSIWRPKGLAATITSIWAESDQTVTFMLQVDDGTPADCDSADLAPAAGVAEDTSLNGDTTLADGDRLDLAVTSVANTPTWCSICWTYTKDD
jgi:hypothetical protein